LEIEAEPPRLDFERGNNLDGQPSRLEIFATKHFDHARFLQQAAASLSGADSILVALRPSVSMPGFTNAARFPRALSMHTLSVHYLGFLLAWSSHDQNRRVIYPI
jgi:hypothetical protein